MLPNLRNTPGRQARREKQAGKQDPTKDSQSEDDEEQEGEANPECAAEALGQGRNVPAPAGDDIALGNVGDQRQHSPSSESTGSWRLLIGDRRVFGLISICKNRSKFFLLVLAAVVALIFSALIAAFMSPRMRPPVASWRPWRHRGRDLGYPRILLWQWEREAPFNVARDLIFRKPQKNSRSSSLTCPAGPRSSVKCWVTDNPEALMRSDAVVFYADRLDRLRVPLQRNPDQLWVFWARDVLPPRKTAHHPSLVTPSFVGLFNLTMARREDADIVVHPETWRCGFPGDKPVRPAEHGSATGAPKSKGEVAWIIGDCEHTRFAYQLHLRNVLTRNPVHPNPRSDGTVPLRLIRGCGKHDYASVAECVKDVADKFHFILVSLLPDCSQSSYELIFTAFRYDIIPVVLVPADFKLDVPDNSVITTADLQGPGQLANYLRELLKDRERYDSYFTWKQHCAFVQPPRDLCALCRLLWRDTDLIARKTHRNVVSWWEHREKCLAEPFLGLEYGFAPHFGEYGNFT
ncbi:alpha-(1,3)-fucosyltransferase fut-3-like [Haemaphysalis longicornis]